MLPDVPQDEWNAHQADQFSSGVDQRLDAMDFNHAADTRINEGLGRIGSWAAPELAQPAPEPQLAPDATQASPPPESPPSVVSGPSSIGLSRAAVSSPTRDLSPDLVAQTLQAADNAGVDPQLYAALIDQESGFNPNAKSPVGAQGLSQLMPDTARGLGVTDPFDIGQNLQAGARYLKQQLDTFGGDVTKALAAYNAGPGSVQQYGGVPPFKETQRYVDSILGRIAAEQSGNAGGGTTPGPTEGIARAGGALATANAARDISQFGDPQLTTEEAYAACGPAAAVRFAQRFGRNPTLKESLDLAKSVGWTSAQGMAGLGSEKALMDKLGVPTKLIQGAQWQTFAQEAATGNPVTISTAGHYFTADGYNADSGAYHVGRSGLDLKGGKEWMTPAEMQNLMGQVQGGLLADNPQVPTPSTADQQTNPLGWLSGIKDAIGGSIGSLFGGSGAGTGETTAQPDQPPAVSPVPAPGLGFDPSHMQPATAPAEGVPLRQDVRDTSQFPQTTVGDVAGKVARSLFLEPLPGTTQLVDLYTKYNGDLDVTRMTPEDQNTFARSMTSALAQTLTPEELVARGAATGAGSLARSGEVAQDLAPAVRRFATEESGELRLPGTDTGVPAADVVVPRNIPERPLPEGAQPINLTPAQETERLRLDKFPEDVRQVIADNAQAIDWARTQRRGVIPDAEAQRLAEQYAADHTLDQVIRQAAPGKAYSTEQIRALRNATAAQAVKVNDIAAEIATGKDTSANLAEFFAEGQRLQRLVQVSEGARAESGRALRAFADPAELLNLSPNDAVARITRLIGGDRQKLLDAVTEYQTLINSGAGPVQMANYWSALQNPVGPADWFKLIRYNSMLSGPRSFEINAIGNALELPWRLARDVGASVARLRPEELQTEVTGMFAGLDRANRNFMETLTHGITSEQATRGEIPRSVSARVSNPVARGVATALEVPGRLMGSADAWANAIAYSMATGRLAARQASREGLRGQAWNTRVAHILSDLTTAPKLMQEADAMAQRMTYHGDMGAFGQGLQAFTEKTGVVGNLILPFLRTVYHITARGIDRSPVGFIGTGIDVARGVYGAGKTLPKGVVPLGERFGDNVMGSVVFGAIYKEAIDGNVSAAGPDDPQRKALLQSEGWQPYSVHLGDKWVSYANWGPAAIPFALAGAAAETQRFAKPGGDVPSMVLDGMRRTAQVVTQQTYLQAIGTVWQGLTDPQRYGFQFVNNTIASLIPYGAAINTVGQATDVVARRPDRFDIGDAIRNRLPVGTPLIGGRETVPAAQDVLGRPAPNTRAGVAAINPLLVSPERADPVLRELDAAGVAPPGPPQTVSRNKKQIALTPDEQRQVQAAAGAVIADRINTEMQTPSYQQLDPEPRKARLERIIERARVQAENRFLETLSEDEYQKRLTQGEAKRVPVPIGGR